ncbi:MAG: tRNA (adenosine(37)-N6)-dimethylallyltransferase MiaA [Gemmatimonadetes bacterium]|nr:tRNA (adenosine(37)-N6)-dimethylallyltransferase MiaA [Gemmatimonadota bacterium]
MSRRPPLAIVGPTASGKSAVALDLARRLGGEIVSMDSRQVYRGMDIGTAKASPAERAEIPHHGLDLVDPDERFSAGAFGRQAREWIAEIESGGRVPIVAGGTGFFLRSLTHPIFSEPPLDPARREALRCWLTRLDDDTLHAWLTRLDPAAGVRFRSWGGRQRLMRGIEVALLSGRTLAWWQSERPAEAPPVTVAAFVLDPPRELLYRSIDERVGAMAAAGLLEEVETLLRRGYDERAPGMNATGYIELIPVVRGNAVLDEALELVRRRTRAYARRQLTWFRHQLPSGALWLDSARPREELVAEIERAYLETAMKEPEVGS